MELAAARFLRDVFNALSHEYRLLLLDRIAHRKDLARLLQICNITRGGLQKHIEVLKEAGLIERKRGGKGPYQLTSRGRMVQKILEENTQKLLPLLMEDRLKRTRENLSTLTTIEEGFGLRVFDKDEIKKLKETRKILDKKGRKWGN